MKQHQVKIGHTYKAKVSGKIATVRIDEVSPYGGWTATNTATGLKIRIKSPQRLRCAASTEPTPILVDAATTHAQETTTMSKKTTKDSKSAKAPKGKKPTAKQKALAAINAAMNETPAPELSPAAHDLADQANPNLADTPVASVPALEEPATKGRKAKEPKPDGKMSGLDAAVKVLKNSAMPLSAKEMVERMLGEGIWTSKGATPDATIYAAIVREIAHKGPESRFKKTDKGRFAAC